MRAVIIAAVTALVVSVICCKIYSIYALKIIDKYAKDIIELAKQSIRNVYVDNTWIGEREEPTETEILQEAGKEVG